MKNILIFLCLVGLVIGSSCGSNTVLDEPQIYKSTRVLLKGDVNQDGEVNVVDITDMIDYLLIVGGSEKRYDINDDGKVSIEDVTALIDLLLSGVEQPDGLYTVNGVKFNMIYVVGGSYMMGAKITEMGSRTFEKPQHQVILSDYRIAETEVTQELWQAVMGSNPSIDKSDPQYPVEYVTWYDCQEFITRLNELTGKRFRLPTEAEWEYAARGGITWFTNYYIFSGSNTCRDVAWYSTTSDGHSHPVKQLPPNAIGLYDMSGNVCEWVNDWYSRYTDDEYQVDPQGPETGNYKVYRFGSWYNNAIENRVSYRYMREPEYRTDYLGLRLAL